MTVTPWGIYTLRILNFGASRNKKIIGYIAPQGKQIYCSQVGGVVKAIVSGQKTSSERRVCLSPAALGNTAPLESTR